MQISITLYLKVSLKCSLGALIQKGNRFCSYSIKTYPFVHENKFSLISLSQANDNVSHKKKTSGTLFK